MICCLDNPKCGSSTLRKWYETLYTNKNIKIIYESKSAYFDKSGYVDSNYMHCNLQGAINLCLRKRIKPRYVDFICVIRHPIERYKSGYLYHNNFHNRKLFDDHLQV